LATAAGLLLAGAARAEFPDRQLRVVVGYGGGTGPDVVARTIGQKLSEILKQSLVVDNRAGAGGQIGAQAVAKGTPDGYTLLLADVGSIAVAPSAFSKLPYTPLKELAALSEVARSDFVLVVPMKSPVTDVASFVKRAKATQSKGEKINVATFGGGTPGHFGAEVFAAMAGFKIEPVHYRATGDAVTAIIAGDVEAAFVTVALATPQVKGGTMRGLATTSPKRAVQLPEVPTFTEAGYPKADFTSWFAFFVPAATPDAIQETLSRAIVTATRDPQVRAKLEEGGFSVIGTSRAEASQMVRNETQRWAQVVKATGFKGD
jgi:tripartite-type tricarboxylate transporter receptor subunit TctC